MAVLPIRITGDPVLHSPALPVTDFDDGLRTLIFDMEETMAAAPGVGLAAPQVGVPVQVFVFNYTDDTGVLWHGTAINPRLLISPTRIGPVDVETESEGCLSIPGERHPLRRAEQAVLSALGIDGRPFEITATGWLARIFQHEYDHLDGVLYSNRLGAQHSKTLAKTIRKMGWSTPGNSWLPGVDHLGE